MVWEDHDGHVVEKVAKMVRWDGLIPNVRFSTMGFR